MLLLLFLWCFCRIKWQIDGAHKECVELYVYKLAAEHQQFVQCLESRATVAAGPRSAQARPLHRVRCYLYYPRYVTVHTCVTSYTCVVTSLHRVRRYLYYLCEVTVHTCMTSHHICLWRDYIEYGATSITRVTSSHITHLCDVTTRLYDVTRHTCTTHYIEYGAACITRVTSQCTPAWRHTLVLWRHYIEYGATCITCVTSPHTCIASHVTPGPRTTSSMVLPVLPVWRHGTHLCDVIHLCCDVTTSSTVLPVLPVWRHRTPV